MLFSPCSVPSDCSCIREPTLGLERPAMQSKVELLGDLAKTAGEHVLRGGFWWMSAPGLRMFTCSSVAESDHHPLDSPFQATLAGHPVTASRDPAPTTFDVQGLSMPSSGPHGKRSKKTKCLFTGE